MEGNSQAPPPELLLCVRCDSAYDPDDNFCRHCGLALHEAQLPAVRDANLPAVWQPALPAAVVRGAALVAAGTVAELLLRRAVAGVLRRGVSARPPARREATSVAPREEPLPDDTQMVSETLLLKRVRFRR